MKRKCTGTTKAGKPCGAPPLKPGTVVDGVTVSGEWCRQHDLDLPDSARIGGATPGAGRPRKPTATEAARGLIERNIAALLTPHFRVLGYDVVDTDDGLVLEPVPGGGAKLHSTYEGVIVVSEHDDLGAMVSAAEKLWDRALGRPRQAFEHTGTGGGPIKTQTLDLRGLDGEELEALEQLLTKATVESDVPAGEDADAGDAG